MRTTGQRSSIAKAESIHIEYDEKGKPYINRTMPLIMNEHFSKKDWKLLCNQLDKALLPTIRFKRNEKRFYVIFGINFLLLIADVVITQMVVREKNNNTNAFQINVGDIVALSHFGITCVVTVAYLLYAMHSHRSIGRTVRTEFRKVCNEMGRLKPSLNFCVYEGEAKGRVVDLRVEVTVSPRKTSSRSAAAPASNFFLVPKMKAPKPKSKKIRGKKMERQSRKKGHISEEEESENSSSDKDSVSDEDHSDKESISDNDDEHSADDDKGRVSDNDDVEKGATSGSVPDHKEKSETSEKSGTLEKSDNVVSGGEKSDNVSISSVEKSNNVAHSSSGEKPEKDSIPEEDNSDKV